VYKKILVPLILALVTTLAFGNVAYAADSASSTSYTRYIGTVLSVDTAARTIHIATNKGQRLTIHVDNNTVYRGKAINLADLAPSMYVNVKTKQTANGQYLAVLVNALNKKASSKLTGQVAAVQASSFSVLGTDGSTYTFQVTSKTSFSGFGVVDISGLSAGMKVKVTYVNMGNGILRATNVVVTQKSSTVSGKVTAKDSSTFTILGTDGNTYTFQVTSNTSFSGKGVVSFSKLKVGMKVKVSYAQLTGGTLRALNVTIRKP
jgi:hypothetical protein